MACKETIEIIFPLIVDIQAVFLYDEIAEVNMGRKTRVVVVRPHERKKDQEHGFSRGWGVLGSLTGSETISMAVGLLPPGTKAAPHSHPFETAIFILEGKARVHFGHQLGHYEDVEAGDFLYIPADVPHGPEVLGVLDMRYVVARAAAEEEADEIRGLS